MQLKSRPKSRAYRVARQDITDNRYWLSSTALVWGGLWRAEDALHRRVHWTSRNMELRIQNLSKRYSNGVQALDHVSLTIGAGMFGLLGPNGAGKSTLMRIIATLQEADSGTARLGSVDVLREKDQVRRILGYLPQEFGLYPKVSALDLLDHFAHLKGVTDRTERRALVESLLHQTNLW